MKCDDCQFRLKCLTLKSVSPQMCGALVDALFQCITKWNEMGLEHDVVDLQLIHTAVEQNDYTVVDTIGIELLQNAKGELEVESRYLRRESEVPGAEPFKTNDW